MPRPGELHEVRRDRTALDDGGRVGGDGVRHTGRRNRCSLLTG